MPKGSEMEGELTKAGGFHVSRCCALALGSALAVVLAVMVAGTYFLAPCPCRTLQAPVYSHRAKSNLYVRLPTAVVPHSYHISILPFLGEGNFTFAGTLVAVINVTSPTYNISIHAVELEISETNVTRIISDVISDSSEQMVSIRFTSHDEEREFFVIHMYERLEPGQYKLHMKYTGKLSDALRGIYRSSYTVGNTTRWLAATQFQPTDARRAFPCFDEPALKAKFTLAIGRAENMTAISNMPRYGQSSPVEGMPGYVWDNFSESARMSTYLVAFVVSDFEHLSEGTFSVWARSDSLQQAKYALEIGPRILRYFEGYFQIPFPLPKVDMIALPDFGAGAMENWGLITYRESTMLYQQGVSENRHKERVGTVVAHELAHQWFGNLVTPSWWSDLWLNEGFATYIECLGVDVVEPSWRTSDQFVVQDMQSVLKLDTYSSSHPVSASVSHPDEIDEIFDSISYGKGAAIIRMMDHFLTTPIFKSGLTNYLKKRAYQSATQDDLWLALTEEAHRQGVLDSTISVKEIMDTWTLQTGFPLITVKRNYEGGSALVTQERFKYHNKTSKRPSRWWIPLSCTNQGKSDFESTKPSYWLKPTENLQIENLNTPSNQWVLFNIKQTGFFRVNYDLENWEMLTKQLMDPKQYLQIGELNRAQIVADSLHLARAGLLNYSVALNITKYLSKEISYIPWAAAFSDLSYIDIMINKMPVYDKFKKYVLSLINKLYDETGFVDNVSDPQLTVYKRVDVLRWACSLGHEDCVRNAVTQYQNWRSSPQPDKNNPISPNLRATVYCSAIREGGQAEWEFAWERYLRSNVGSEKSLLLTALACTRETWILSRYLHWSITENSGIRKQDASSVFGAVSENVIGQPLAFAFLRDNWQRIRKYFGSPVFIINTVIKVTTNDMNTDFELKMLRDFTAEHLSEMGTATAVFEQSLERVEVNVNWMKNSYKQIEEWLSANV